MFRSLADRCNEFLKMMIVGQFFTSLASLALAMFELTVVRYKTN
jgi:hypothetical protein